MTSVAIPSINQSRSESDPNITKRLISPVVNDQRNEENRLDWIGNWIKVGEIGLDSVGGINQRQVALNCRGRFSLILVNPA